MPDKFPRAEVEAALALGLAEMKTELPADTCAQLVSYIALLARWNRAYALSGVRDPLQMVSTHVLDSLVVAPHLVGERCLDVGTGEGVPGLVLAIVDPDRRWTLLDASMKKVTFCRQVLIELGVKNAVAVHARVESLPGEEPFDCITTRATFAPARTAALVGRLLNPAGVLLCMQGQRPEMGAYAHIAGFEPAEIAVTAVPGTDHRHLLKLRVAAVA